MKATPLIALATALVALSTNASAEFTLGLQAGSSGTNLEVVDGEYDERERAKAYGVFAQYGYAVNNRLTMGVHLGWAADGAEWEILDTYTGTYAGIPDDDGDNEGLLIKREIEIDDVLDLLAFLKYDYAKVSPFIMLGFSRMDADFMYTSASNDNRSKDDITLTGAKIALGLEFPLGENVVFHALAHYADYGKESVIDFDDTKFEIETERSGIQVGIAYTF